MIHLQGHIAYLGAGGMPQHVKRLANEVTASRAAQPRVHTFCMGLRVIHTFYLGTSVGMLSGCYVSHGPYRNVRSGSCRKDLREAVELPRRLRRCCSPRAQPSMVRGPLCLFPSGDAPDGRACGGRRLTAWVFTCPGVGSPIRVLCRSAPENLAVLTAQSLLFPVVSLMWLSWLPSGRRCQSLANGETGPTSSSTSLAAAKADTSSDCL